jgi:hypothetical protein
MKPAYLCGLLLLTLGPTLFGQTPTITGVSNDASGAPAIESGSWVSIYGTGLAATTRQWQASDFTGNNLPTTLDGVSVLIDGKKAAISYVSPGQLNVQAPTDTATGPVPVQVTNSPARLPARQRCKTIRRRSSLFRRNMPLPCIIPMASTWRRPEVSGARPRRGRPSPGKRFRSTPLAWPHHARRAGRPTGRQGRAPVGPHPTARDHRRRGRNRAVRRHRGGRGVPDQRDGPASAERRSADSGNHRRCEFPDRSRNSRS